ncbi:PAS domain-containing protein [Polaromonas aquatica]|uniref:PAS domain-containing protein n=1 Tax=Polaromonas aquatica TaxID=332657 RepID=UPI003D653A96
MLRTIAEKQLASQTSWTQPSSETDRLKLIHELQVHQIELQIQTDVLRETLARADALRAKYQDLFEFAPVGYLTLSKRGTIFEANKCAAALLNQKPQALVGRKLREFVKEDFVARVDSFLGAVGKSTKDMSLREIALLPYKPFTRFVNMQAHSIAKESTGEEQIRLAIMDVSALKAATDDVVQAIERASSFGALE